MPQARRIRVRALWLASSLLLVIVGCTGPWAVVSISSFSFELSGTDGPNHGTAVVVLACAAVALTVATGAQLRLRIVALAVAAIAVALVVHDWRHILALDVEVGWGLYAALAGAALLVVDVLVLTLLESGRTPHPPASAEPGAMFGSYRPKLLRSRQRGMRL